MEMGHSLLCSLYSHWWVVGSTLSEDGVVTLAPTRGLLGALIVGGVVTALYHGVKHQTRGTLACICLPILL